MEINNSNNLIKKTLNDNKVVGNFNNNFPSNKIVQNSTPAVDKFNKTPDKNNSSLKTDIIKGTLSVLPLLALFFLPDLIMGFKNKKQVRLNRLYSQLKPLIGENITSEKSVKLKNGLTKITLENDKGKFVDREFIILDSKNKIIKRIITKKEKMKKNKYILREMKSFKGDNLLSNEKLKKNYDNFLFKHYRRSKIINNQSNVSIIAKNNKVNYTLYSSNIGEPVLRTRTKDKEKENVLFLYDGLKCIGTDKQIISEDRGTPIYNILNIPQKGIKNKRYSLEQDGSQYNENLIQKLRENF